MTKELEYAGMVGVKKPLCSLVTENSPITISVMILVATSVRISVNSLLVNLWSVNARGERPAGSSLANQ